VLAATDYPLLNIFWSMILLFLWIAWFWILIVVIMDVFRRHDIGGLAKTLWLIFLILIPFLGVLIYVIVEGQHMTERRMQEQIAAQKQFDQYVRQTAASSAGGGGAAAEIQQAQQLLASGAITQEEFEQIKRKALGT
jgi:predicted PurR-regulated permease PerM